MYEALWTQGGMYVLLTFVFNIGSASLPSLHLGSLKLSVKGRIYRKINSPLASKNVYVFWIT